MAECQFGNTLDEIRDDHVGRYEWAAERVRGSVLDIACGCGYGSHILAEAGYRVSGVDNRPEAIGYADAHWRHPRAMFFEFNALIWAGGPYDWIVCFETLEHLEQDELFLTRMRAKSSNLLISVPNENVIPKTPGRFRYHHRHYTPGEFKAILTATGWEVEGLWHQPTHVSREPQPGTDGRTIIAQCVGA